MGLGLIGYATVTALGRNPEARGAILTNMILVAALTEAVGIYALIVSIILGHGGIAIEKGLRRNHGK